MKNIKPDRPVYLFPARSQIPHLASIMETRASLLYRRHVPHPIVSRSTDCYIGSAPPQCLTLSHLLPYRYPFTTIQNKPKEWRVTDSR